MARNAVSPIVMAERDPSMPRYTEEQRARLMALPSAMLTATLVMGATDPVATVRDVLDEMRYFREMREAYPGNDLIQGMLQDAENPLPGLHLSSSPIEKLFCTHYTNISRKQAHCWVMTPKPKSSRRF